MRPADLDELAGRGDTELSNQKDVSHDSAAMTARVEK